MLSCLLYQPVHVLLNKLSYYTCSAYSIPKTNTHQFHSLFLHHQLFSLVLYRDSAREVLAVTTDEKRSKPSKRPTHPPMETVKHRANKILDSAAMSTRQLATVEENAFPFLSLPVELQTQVVNYFSHYSDLKALRLVSQQLSCIVIPRLYYEVDLRSTTIYNRPLKQRIKSLLIQPTYLRFVRILSTPELGSQETRLMDRLLPLLRQDSLTEFNFWTISAKKFPTALQMQFMWANQKYIQYVKLYAHMVPVFDQLLKVHGSSRDALLNSITELHMTDLAGDWVVKVPSMICWPLRNLDLSILWKMRIDGLVADDYFLSTLNTLFARGSFVNLSILSFAYIFFRKELTLTNLPSLKTLALDVVRMNESSHPLILADDIKLSSFHGWTWSEIEKFSVLLAQTSGLEFLSIEIRQEIRSSERILKDLASEIIRHQHTLRVLDLKEGLLIETKLGARLWDFHIVKAIKSCRKLVDLSFTLGSGRPPCYYLSLFQSLPNLTNLTIYGRNFNNKHWSRNSIPMLLAAAERLESIVFKGQSPNSFHRLARRYLL